MHIHSPQWCESGSLVSSLQDSLEVSVHDRHVLPRHDIKLVSDRRRPCFFLIGLLYIHETTPKEPTHIHVITFTQETKKRKK